VPVLDDFKAKLLAAGVGDSETRQALAVLSGMFIYAEQRGHVARNPVRLVKKPSGKRKRAVV
jgi:site-specific recombinase XerD